MKISIVTVCYNEERSIKQTIESVLGQTYQNIEYVIIDGKSTDGTMEIVTKYIQDSRLIIISEKDEGLFNAMNKSLDILTGEYVIFMNSGDVFYDQDVLKDVSEELDSDIVYGDVFRRKREGSFIQKYKGTSLERFVMMMCGLAFCHQAQFTKTELMKQYKFDETHRITADYDFVVRAIKNKCSFKHLDRVICNFDYEGGISANKSNYKQMTIEDDESIKRNLPFFYYLTIAPKKLFRIFFR